MINQINAFIFLYLFATRICNYKKDLDKIMNRVIIIFFISIIISIIFRIIGGDAIKFYNHNMYIRYQGSFSDKRLTYIFNHKSEYGLILLVFFMYVLYYFKSRYRKVILIGIILTLVLTNSMISIGCATIILVTYIYAQYWQRCNKYIKIALTIFSGLAICSIGIIVILLISNVRDLSTLGSRSVIWKYAFNYLIENSKGIGTNFQNITFDVGLDFYVNNFHNVFLNEMLQFSNIVGILYSILIISIVIFSIFNYNNKIVSFINTGVVILPLLFDNSLWTSTLPIYIVIIYMFGYQSRRSKEIS
ncbi:hypothetical protein LQE93_11020 [Clostridium sp. NSJ-145]|uniref:hypothetical protein n=1 Tax=Clostridium sp. NSJ-145 TaxID=2897777 RepID=UPI001E44232C|nr:hypothetical protein [Clostridium sp. NSJ-145]MCD2502311.1 hypothetical protein [Clostridium sp. NSJ-145]